MRFRSLSLFLLLTALLAGCDSTTPSPPEQFPNLLQRGDAWTYNVRFTERPVDSSAVDTLFAARVRMEVTKTDVDLDPRSGLVELTVFPVAAPDSVEHTWYQQSPDSLVDVAYTTPLATTGTLPLTQEKEAARPLPAGRGLTGLPLLVRRHRPATSPAAPRDTVVRTDSRVVLKTPLDRGATWTSFRDPFLSVRTVAGDTTVETPAGRFSSVEVETALPNLAPTLHWSDYVGAEGLVRRVVTDTLERRDETGRPVGPVVSREVYTLTAYRE